MKTETQTAEQRLLQSLRDEGKNVTAEDLKFYLAILGGRESSLLASIKIK